MSIQHYMELESGLSLPELVELLKETPSRITVESETLARIDTVHTSFDILVDMSEREKRAVPLGVQTDAMLIFWVRVYDMGFAKGIRILLNTTMNLAYYYEDMDDPMYYRVNGKVFVNMAFGWGEERLEVFKNIPHDVMALTKPE